MSANPNPHPYAMQAAMVILDLAHSPEAWRVFWDAVGIALSDVNPGLVTVEEAAVWEAWAALAPPGLPDGPTPEPGAANEPEG